MDLTALLSEIPRPALVLAGFGVAFVTLLWLALRGRAGRRAYRRAGPLFTPAELRFLAALEKAVAGRARVYGKVRLADVLAVKDSVSGKHFWRAFNAIACKHLDYVLCERDTLAVILAIELDDRSHARDERRARDAFVDEALAGAGIPLLRFPVRGRYAQRELDEALRPWLPPRI